jgi:serine/threonine protein kinase
MPASALLGRAPGQPVSIDDFTLVKVIGKGSFGKVFLVRPAWTPVGDATVFAMKVVKKAEVARRNQAEHTMAERRIMALVKHPFIVPLVFAFQVEGLNVIAHIH